MHVPTTEAHDLRQLFPRVHSKIEESESIIIALPDPDIDALCSMRLLKEYVAFYWPDKPCHLSAAGTIPTPEQNYFMAFLREGPEPTSIKLPLPKPCGILFVDYGSVATCNIAPEVMRNCSAVIGFDHHAIPAPDFPKEGLHIWDPAASSTTELLYHYFSHTGMPLTKAMATWVVLGILADTGGGRLSHPKMNSTALRVIEHCIDKGIPWKEIQKATRPKISRHRAEIWQKLLDAWYLDRESGIVSLTISQSTLRNWRADTKDVHTFMGIMQYLEGAKLAVLILQRPDDTWKIMLRSVDTDEISASDLARALGGGGHRHAAAAIWDGNPSLALDVIKRKLGNEKERNKIYL